MLQSTPTAVEKYLLETAAAFAEERRLQAELAAKQRSSNPFVAAMEGADPPAHLSSSTVGASSGGPDSRTANGGACYSLTGDATVNLFFSLGRGSDAGSVGTFMERSWRQSPEETLQILLQLRDSRDGRGERLVAYHALMWLREHKPVTYANVLPYVLRFGSFRDLNALARMANARRLLDEGSAAPEYLQRQSCGWKRAREHRLLRGAGRKRGKAEGAAATSVVVQHVEPAGEMEPAPSASSVSATKPQAPSAATEDSGLGDCIELAMFAEALRRDSATLIDWKSSQTAEVAPLLPSSSSSSSPAAASSETTSATPLVVGSPVVCSGLSLAAKWAPTEHGSDDTQMRMATRLARLLFPKVQSHSSRMKQYRGMLSSLREHLRLVERAISSGGWATIDYGQIPSRAHLRLKTAFFKHTPERYKAYLDSLRKVQEKNKAATLAAEAMEDVDSSAAAADPVEMKSEEAEPEVVEEEEHDQLAPSDVTLKINTVGVYPHEILKPWLPGTSYIGYSGYSGVADSTDTTQRIASWEDLIARMRSEGNLRNALAVVDVSGSMTGTPMDVALSLGLVISEVSRGPFKDRFITFSSVPTWHHIVGATIHEKLANMSRASWCMSTNLEAVFDLILSTAQTHQVKQEDLPSMLLIMSDMQFNDCMHNSNQTVFQQARERFAAAGYTLPAVCFWNLQSGVSNGSPVQHNDQGVMLLSGYSPALLKSLMQDEDIAKNMAEFTPAKMLTKSLHAYSEAVPWQNIIASTERC
jgi:hypothetical protein